MTTYIIAYVLFGFVIFIFTLYKRYKEELHDYGKIIEEDDFIFTGFVGAAIMILWPLMVVFAIITSIANFIGKLMTKGKK
jgi:hypothetical protein